MAGEVYEYAGIGEVGPIEFYERACQAKLIPVFYCSLECLQFHMGLAFKLRLKKICGQGGWYMEFDVRAERLSMFGIFGLILVWNILTDIFGFSIPSFTIILVLIVVFSAFRFKFEVSNEQLLYRLLFFKKTINTRKLSPGDISQITFVRQMWVKKAVMINVRNGRKIRLVELYPSTAFDYLVEFADKHEVELHKTRDYLRLEKKMDK